MALNARLEYSSEPTVPLIPPQEQARLRILQKLQSGVYQLEDVPCYCGGLEDREIARRDRYGFEVRTVLCMRCGLLRTSPRMTAESSAAFYRDDYRALYTDGSIDLETFHQKAVWKGNDLIRFMPKLLSRVDTVFEIGCASGGMLEAFSQIGKRIAGCDMNAEYLAFGRARGLDLVEGEVEELVHHTECRADLVILSHVIEHFFDLRNELKRAISAVRENGFILIIVPTLETVKSSYCGDIIRYFQNAHTYHFSAATLRYVLQSVGLRVIAVEPIGWALAERPMGWDAGTVQDVPLPESAAMENLSLILTLEAAFAAAESR